ncbi:MAG: trypsin-like peptidase domain-containing protein [Mycobacteriaceae bacterium]|nr:trypsin-like peptidase domain-containing protein [Mycobacteriaceae bacterium]
MAQLQPQRPPRPGWWLSIVAALVAALAFVAPGYAPSTHIARAAPGDPSTANVEQSMVQINAVVNYQGVVGYGAGIVLSPDGVVLTNNHVVAGADSMDATIVGSGQAFKAKLLGYDRTEDIALIQLLGAGGLPTAPIGDSNQVTVGEPVVGLGNANGNGKPISREQGQVTTLGANISAEDDLTGSSEQLTNLIGVAAPVRPGDSGGPLVDNNGQVIGLTVAASVNYKLGSPGGKGFAIPINRALGVANQIQARAASGTVHIGPPAMLGIGVGVGQQRTSGGVVVRDVLPGTPAEQTGLHQGDVIISLDGVALTDATALTSVLDRHYPGDAVDLVWQDRTGQQRSAKVTLGTGPGG